MDGGQWIVSAGQGQEEILAPKCDSMPYVEMVVNEFM